MNANEPQNLEYGINIRAYFRAKLGLSFSYYQKNSLVHGNVKSRSLFYKEMLFFELFT